MITLKAYQSRVLDSLRDFFRMAARQQDPETAFREITTGTFGTATPYIPVNAPNFKELVLSRLPLPTKRRARPRRGVQGRPFICRGGGKTRRRRCVGKP
jgi:hypothetical protein